MLKYELATSLTLNIEKYCYSYLNGLADLWYLRGGARQWEFLYIYKSGNPSGIRGRAYLFHVFFLTTTKNFNEIQRSILRKRWFPYITDVNQRHQQRRSRIPTSSRV